jgi:predicted phosphodiesterase
VAAKSFIENLELQIASRSRQVVICPGNHDLKWSDEPEVKDNKVTTVSGDAREEYNRFYRQLFYQDANEFMTMGRRLLLGQAHPIEIASLNSSHLQQEKGHFQGHGFTGEDQRRQVEEEMNWKSRNKHPRTTRILVVHHDVLPTSFTERLQKEAPYSLMLDAEGLLQWATKNRIDIILHGHKHQPSYNVIQRPLRNGEMHTVHVLAAGSAGVKSGHLAEINRNTVTVLTFENESVHCETYPVRPSASTEDPIERHTHTLSLSAS